jgi:serine/threonine-protein kinase
MSESESQPASDESQPGALVAHYRIRRKLGEGGMGIVYVADDTKLRRTVALKVLHGDVAEDSERRKRFVREGRLAAGLTHPCLATVYEVGEADGRVFIAMELIEGRSLGAMIREGGALPLFQGLRIAREVVRGLVKAHESGIIHRDLKPENVMVGEDQIVKILDFGVAKRTDDQSNDVTDLKTKQGSLIGTPAYMSPEQAAGKAVDARSDIFSVGVMLYEMLTGKRPFYGDTWQETIISVARDPLVSPSSLRPDIPDPVEHAIRRCLEKKADDRYPSCRALLDDLDRLLLDSAAGQPISDALAVVTRVAARTSELSSNTPDPSAHTASPLETDAPAPTPTRSNRALLAALFVGSLLIGVGVALQLAPRDRAPASPRQDATAPVAAAASAPATDRSAPAPTAHAEATSTAIASASAAPAPAASVSPAKNAHGGGSERKASEPVAADPKPVATAAPGKASKKNAVLGF